MGEFRRIEGIRARECHNRGLLPDLPPGMVPFATDLNASRDGFERSIHAEDVEIGAAFTINGAFVLRPRQGKSDEVDFDLVEAPLLAGSVVTHNHPTGFPFSEGDAELAAERDVAELRAVCPSGVCFSIKRPVVGWPSTDKMIEAAISAVLAFAKKLYGVKRKGFAKRPMSRTSR